MAIFGHSTLGMLSLSLGVVLIQSGQDVYNPKIFEGPVWPSSNSYSYFPFLVNGHISLHYFAGFFFTSLVLFSIF